MNFYTRFALCFTVAAVVDAFWALYIRRSGAGRALSASVYAGLLMVFGMFNTESWLQDKRICAAIVLGSMLGTYVMVKHDHKK